MSITKNKETMSQKIKLVLTEEESITLRTALRAQQTELGKAIKQASPVKDYLRFKVLQHEYLNTVKILDLIEEPYLV